MSSAVIGPTTGQLASGAGLFWRESIGVAPQVSNAINFLNVSSASGNRFVAPYAGQVLGFCLGLDTAITAGTLTIECFINNASAATKAFTSADTAPLHAFFATPAAFSANQTIDFRYSIDAGFTGSTTVQVIGTIYYF